MICFGKYLFPIVVVALNHFLFDSFIYVSSVYFYAEVQLLYVFCFFFFNNAITIIYYNTTYGILITL